MDSIQLPFFLMITHQSGSAFTNLLAIAIPRFHGINYETSLEI